MAASAFLIEAVIMNLLPLLRLDFPRAEMLLDAGMLTLALVPILYGALLRPMAVRISALTQAAMEREKLVGELRGALAQVKLLSGFIPICSSCKKIRDDKGYWETVEKYVTQHSDARFSHGLCPDCGKKVYGELYEREFPQGS
ncbi:MAG: hypothetical protein A2V88_07935 [Elusimicrobia bacterium RBG_16_66_12]|nr:MAG: hypothetical protein A2V88_07935 [Elusimicrobia bacterium RBG_16_66_12]